MEQAGLAAILIVQHSAFVATAGGAKVTKHGNKAIPVSPAAQIF